MYGTSKCFYAQKDDIIEQLAVGYKLQVLSSHPIDIPPAPGLATTSLSLREAIKLPFALHLGENSFLVLNNTLWISASEQLYHRAGLEMKKLKCGRFFTKVDLTSLNNRFKWSLDNVLTTNLEFIVEKGTGTASTSQFTCPVPPFSVSKEEINDWAAHIYEWIGLATLKSPALQGNLNPVLCNYFHYPGTSSPQQVNLHSVQGLFTPAYIRDLLKSSTNADWIVISLHGFDQSPMAWNKPHSWDLGGEYGYTVVRGNNTAHSFKLVSRGDL